MSKRDENIFVIIQARMNSSRLYGKVMFPLCGKSVLEMMIKRLDSFRENIIIATSKGEEQQPILNLCQKRGIKYFRGSQNDVLGRYYEAALTFGAKSEDIIVRLTSDCPMIDEGIVKKTVDFYRRNNFEYVSNVIQRTFPRGMDTEVFSFDALKEAYKNAKKSFEREHVTPWIIKNYKNGSFLNEINHSRYRLTLDEQKDYLAIKELFVKLGCRSDFDYDEMINILIRNPHIADMNKEVKQKEYECSF